MAISWRFGDRHQFCVAWRPTERWDYPDWRLARRKRAAHCSQVVACHASLSGYSRRAKWSDVFRLVPGQSVTLGRAPTNQIVLKDERCSRIHAEIPVVDDQWTLRDLGSRNGTMVGRQRLESSWALQPGDVIRIGHCNWPLFTNWPRLSAIAAALPHRRQRCRTAGARPPVRWKSPPCSDCSEPATIMHRRGQTRYLDAGRNRTTAAFRGRVGPRPGSAAWLSNWPKPPTWPPWPMRPWQASLKAPLTDAGGVLLLAARSSRRAPRRAIGIDRARGRPAAATSGCRTSWPLRSCGKARRCWPAT